MNTYKIETTINRRSYSLDINPNQTLLDLLRDELGLMGTKRGCEVGECGACTVLMNGKAVNSCLVLAPQIDGKEIVTVESLVDGEILHPLQESFLDHEAVHCGARAIADRSRRRRSAARGSGDARDHDTPPRSVRTSEKYSSR